MRLEMSQELNLDVVRRGLLRWPVAASLDLVATDPNAVRRCIIVAKVVQQMQDDEQLGEEASAALEVLRNEAKRRLNGERPHAPPLTTVSPSAAGRPKERSFA